MVNLSQNQNIDLNKRREEFYKDRGLTVKSGLPGGFRRQIVYSPALVPRGSKVNVAPPYHGPGVSCVSFTWSPLLSVMTAVDAI